MPQWDSDGKAFSAYGILAASIGETVSGTYNLINKTGGILSAENFEHGSSYLCTSVVFFIPFQSPYRQLGASHRVSTCWSLPLFFAPSS